VLAEHLHVDLGLAPGEVAVEHRLGHPGPVDDLLDLGLAVAALAEDVLGGSQKPLAPLISGKSRTHRHKSYLR